MEGDDDDYIWTAEDYKRASSTSPLEFARFDAMRRFDQRHSNSLKFNDNSHMKTRMEYARLVNKSITNVLPEMEGEGGESESESESEKKKMEGEGGECESEEPEKKKRKLTDKKKKKNFDLYDHVSPYDVFHYYAREIVYTTIDPEDPDVQAEVAQKRKLFEEKCKLVFGGREGPATAEAKAEDAIEAAPLLV